MNTLVVNCGSSSLKCRLYGDEQSVLAHGSVESIGRTDALLVFTVGQNTKTESLPSATHASAFDALCDAMAPDAPVHCVGHRIVHGGERFREAALLDDEVEQAIEALAPLAPLHNPVCLVGIRSARERFPDAQHVAIFDTAFHQTIPEAAFLYALPYKYYEQDGVRRYGFHGSSHRSVSARAIELLDLEGEPSRLITCHLGAGCSTAAVRDGASVDTSMGMTPLEGLVMATRSGDIDAGIIGFLARKHGLSATYVEDVLLHESGLQGLSGISGDMRELLREASTGNPRAEIAIAVFVHRVRKYLGAHLATLGGADAIVMTGGAGENSAVLRARILEGMEGLGIELDRAANEAHLGREGLISLPSSRTAIYVIPANEELSIAREARDLVERL